jgi:hypothetical protein
LHTSITQECVCVVVDNLKAGLIELGRSMVLSNGKTNGIRETLAKRAGSNLDSIGIVSLRVARSDAVDSLNLL